MTHSSKDRITESKKEKKQKKIKKSIKNKCKETIENNFVRQISNYLNRCFNKHFSKYFSSIENISLSDLAKGSVYSMIHNFIIVVVFLVAIFNFSIIHLAVLLNIISLDAISIVVLHGCPLTHMEKKYLGFSGMDMHYDMLKSMNICYDCDHFYEQQVELLINVWCIIACKILFILLFKTFSIKLFDVNNIFDVNNLYTNLKSIL